MRLVLGLLLVIALVGCSTAAPTPLAQLPSQPTATDTPAPSPTTQPTAVPSATATATASATSIPSATATATATPSPTSSGALAASDLAAQMVIELNQQRAVERCAPLTADPRLTSAAQLHADEISRRREVSHRSADGSTLEQRLQRAGYPFVRRSETIAVSKDETIGQVVALWLDEPLDGPHRSTIMNCLYQHVGVGVAWTEADVFYWVVDYGQPQP